MGRVYDVRPDVSKGERGGTGYRVLVGGRKVVNVYRVELDDDDDEGMATVYAFFASGGAILADHDGTGAVRVSFRHRVKVVPKHEPADGPAAVAARSADEVLRMAHRAAAEQAAAFLADERRDIYAVLTARPHLYTPTELDRLTHAQLLALSERLREGG